MKHHKLTFSKKEETWEGSHSREHTTYYDVVNCSCGFEAKSIVSTDDSGLANQVLSHKVDALLKAAGIKFSEVKV